MRLARGVGEVAELDLEGAELREDGGAARPARVRGPAGREGDLRARDARGRVEGGQQPVRQVARALGYLVFRVTYSDGAQRVWRGQPSIPGESVAQGALGNGQMTVTVKGQICYLAAL